VIVLVLTLLTLISSVAKYRLGKSGLPTVKERFPRVSDERWERLDRYFLRWGAAFVFFSFLPILALVVPAAAGALIGVPASYLANFFMEPYKTQEAAYDSSDPRSKLVELRSLLAQQQAAQEGLESKIAELEEML
jgi:hypothetical protein